MVSVGVGLGSDCNVGMELEQCLTALIRGWLVEKRIPSGTEDYLAVEQCGFVPSVIGLLSSPVQSQAVLLASQKCFSPV